MMKLTPTFHLNDPFEARLTDDFISNLGVEYKKLFKDKYDSIFPRFEETIQENSRYKGIVSFSRKACDIKMLSHYASDHAGGILEFEVENLSEGYNNVTSLFNTQDPVNYNFGDVKYDEARRVVISDDFDKYLSTDMFFEKFIDWDEEEEVRYTSDFRNADTIIISKESLVKNYFDELKEHGFFDLVSWHIDEDCFYYIYESFNYDENKNCFYRSKDKKIRSIIGKIFKENIHSYKEINENVILKLKCNTHSYFGIDQGMSWRRFLKRDYDFHPMIKVNPEALTGVFLGCKFNETDINDSIINKFPNLSGNIMKTKLCGNSFILKSTKLF